ncbi:MAG: OmpH family outer membrane protein [Lentisphaerae bacterium]|nr:OmpH family outer membrane protein [Lentisphaerota bacterium]
MNRSILRKVLCSSLLALLLTAYDVQASGQKIATVDLEKAFNSYYKTKLIDQDFTDQGKLYRNYIARQAEQLRKDEQLLRQKLDASLNVALAPAERQKRQDEVNKLEQSLRMRRAQLEQEAADRAKSLQESAVRERRKVVDEIRAEIRRRAAIEGYTIVLDRTGKSMNDAPLVLFSADSIDITDKVITELNRGAKAAGASGKKTQ